MHYLTQFVLKQNILTRYSEEQVFKGETGHTNKDRQRRRNCILGEAGKETTILSFGDRVSFQKSKHL